MSTIDERTARLEAQLMQRLADESEVLADADVPADVLERTQQAEQMRAAAVQAADSMSNEDFNKLLANRRLLTGVAQQMNFDEARGELGLADQFATFAFGRHFRYVAEAATWVRYDELRGTYVDAEADAAELAKFVVQSAVDRARRALRLTLTLRVDDDAITVELAASSARGGRVVVAAHSALRQGSTEL